MTETVLVGTDGSEGAERALEYAAERARQTNAELVIAYVIEWSPYSFNTPSENEQRHQRREAEIERAEEDVLNPLIEKYSSEGLSTRKIVRHGHAAQVLKTLGKELDARHIVIGRKGSTKLQALLFGSVAASLVQIADRPVTVVP